MRRNALSLILPSFTFLTVLGTLLDPSPSWALQSHETPEGLYVHQMAHIIFMVSLAYLAWGIHRIAFSGRGWKHLQFFCFLMFLWNGIALIGHSVSITINKSDFFTESTYWYTELSGPFTLSKVIYYIAKLDHIASVPALLFLFLALRSFYISACTEKRPREDS